MTSATSARTLEVRHLQLARAAFAAIAAIMVTFSTDHSAAVGLAVFGGFGIATALVLALAAWLVLPRGKRWPTATLAALTFVAALAASIGSWRSTTTFFVILVTWALVTGVVEAGAALLMRKDAAGSTRDALTIGILTIAFGLALLFIDPGYSLQYYIEDAGRSFDLTGITIAVGVFGGYAAIVAVFLGIAGFSPRREPVAPGSEGKAP